MMPKFGVQEKYIALSEKPFSGIKLDTQAGDYKDGTNLNEESVGGDKTSQIPSCSSYYWKQTLLSCQSCYRNSIDGIKTVYKKEWLDLKIPQRCFVVLGYLVKLAIIVSLYLTIHRAQREIRSTNQKLSEINENYQTALHQIGILKSNTEVIQDALKIQNATMGNLQKDAYSLNRTVQTSAFKAGDASMKADYASSKTVDLLLLLQSQNETVRKLINDGMALNESVHLASAMATGASVKALEAVSRVSVATSKARSAVLMASNLSVALQYQNTTVVKLEALSQKLNITLATASSKITEVSSIATFAQSQASVASSKAGDAANKLNIMTDQTLTLNKTMNDFSNKFEQLVGGTALKVGPQAIDYMLNVPYVCRKDGLDFYYTATGQPDCQPDNRGNPLYTDQGNYDLCHVPRTAVASTLTAQMVLKDETECFYPSRAGDVGAEGKCFYRFKILEKFCQACDNNPYPCDHNNINSAYVDINWWAYNDVNIARDGTALCIEQKWYLAPNDPSNRKCFKINPASFRVFIPLDDLYISAMSHQLLTLYKSVGS